jgi:hypothetical protein
MANESISDLAGAIGLGTNNRYANTMPLTRAATKAVEIDQADKRLEQQQKLQEKKLEEQMQKMYKLNVSGVDDIGARDLTQKHNKLLISKGFGTDEEANYNADVAYHKEATLRNKNERTLLEGDKLLVKDEVKDALLNKNAKALEKLAQDPENNLTKDPFNRYFIASHQNKANIKEGINDVHALYTRHNDNWDLGQGKLEAGTNKMAYEAKLKPAAKEGIVNDLFAEPDWAKTYIFQNKKAIEKSLIDNGDPINKLTIIDEAKNHFKRTHPTLFTNKVYLPIPSSGKKGGLSLSFGGGGEIFDENIKVDPTEIIGVYNISQVGKSPIIKSRTLENKNNKVENFDVVQKIVKNPDGTFDIKGQQIVNGKNGEKDTSIPVTLTDVPKSALKSFMKVKPEMLEKMKSISQEDYNEKVWTAKRQNAIERAAYGKGKEELEATDWRTFRDMANKAKPVTESVIINTPDKKVEIKKVNNPLIKKQPR